MLNQETVARVLFTYTAKNSLPKEDLMGVMGAEGDTLSFAPIPTCGLFILLSFKNILWPVMEETVVKIEAVGRKEKMFLLKYRWGL